MVPGACFSALRVLTTESLAWRRRRRPAVRIDSSDMNGDAVCIVQRSQCLKNVHNGLVQGPRVWWVLPGVEGYLQVVVNMCR